MPKLCQNPICLGCRELLFEREQLPQVVDNKHFRMERMEHLEPVIVLRNQQVAGSIPAGGSRILKYLDNDFETFGSTPATSCAQNCAYVFRVGSLQIDQKLAHRQAHLAIGPGCGTLDRPL